MPDQLAQGNQELEVRSVTSKPYDFVWTLHCEFISDANEDGRTTTKKFWWLPAMYIGIGGMGGMHHTVRILSGKLRGTFGTTKFVYPYEVTKEGSLVPMNYKPS
ncbi:hypothetical protein BDN70DRAFT_938337 [Pholiota conissans]|uniref:Uncharacterized protein n=1 Tax=Pholiota conissans TaxID=109636 RepID=A0A9P5YP99_9AGAR|nr:hypothetical protein BDN70DRAFT_938337 [Pholiota conissans]